MICGEMALGRSGKVRPLTRSTVSRPVTSRYDREQVGTYFRMVEFAIKTN